MTLIAKLYFSQHMRDREVDQSLSVYIEILYKFAAFISLGI